MDNYPNYIQRSIIRQVGVQRTAILNMTRLLSSSPKKVLNYRPMWEISGRNRANFKIPSRNNRHIENCCATYHTLPSILNSNIIPPAIAEEIIIRHPSLRLADVYSVIAYYLDYRANKAILEWAFQEEQILLRHDAHTMTFEAYNGMRTVDYFGAKRNAG